MRKEKNTHNFKGINIGFNHIPRTDIQDIQDILKIL